jgi:signal peptidase I
VYLSLVNSINFGGSSHYINDGRSMEPTLFSNDIVTVNTRSIEYDIGNLIVYSEHQADLEKLYIKRIIGKAGDALEIRDNKIYLNGKILNENYILNGLRPFTWKK